MLIKDKGSIASHFVDIELGADALICGQHIAGAWIARDIPDVAGASLEKLTHRALILRQSLHIAALTLDYPGAHKALGQLY